MKPKSKVLRHPEAFGNGGSGGGSHTPPRSPSMRVVELWHSELKAGKLHSGMAIPAAEFPNQFLHIAMKELNLSRSQVLSTLIKESQESLSQASDKRTSDYWGNIISKLKGLLYEQKERK